MAESKVDVLVVEDEPTLLRIVCDALRAAGVRVRSYGPDDYETTTGYHHIAATCEWVEKINQEV